MYEENNHIIESKIGLCGFRNIGNTCYMNSILQLLTHTKLIVNFLLAKSNPFIDSNGNTYINNDGNSMSFYELVKNKLVNADFVNYLQDAAVQRIGDKERKRLKLKDDDEVIINKSDIDNFIEYSITIKLAEIINAIIYKGNSNITPTGFKYIIDRKIPALRGWGQQDSHELLNGILDILIEETGIESEPIINNVPNVIHEYIEFLKLVRHKITSVDTQKEKIEIIREFNEYKKNNNDVINKYNGLNYMMKIFKNRYNPMIYKFETFTIDTIICNQCNHQTCNYQYYTILMLHIKPTLKECFDNFIEKESVDRKCEICNGKSATKFTKIWRPGMTLYIELCRFSNLPNGKTYKNNLDVEIPDYSDIREYCDSSMRTDETFSYKYKLKGISNHLGSLGGGHYTADCVSIVDDNTWYHFDDSNVSRHSNSNINKSSSYILLYEMCN